MHWISQKCLEVLIISMNVMYTWKVLKRLNFDVMTPTMSRNIFEVIWRFLKNWNPFCNWKGFLTVSSHITVHDAWWFTKSFELIKGAEGCFPMEGSSSPPLPPLMLSRVKFIETQKIPFYFFHFLCVVYEESLWLCQLCNPAKLFFIELTVIRTKAINVCLHCFWEEHLYCLDL